MTKEAANPNDDILFGGLDLGGIEETLLTVDLAEGEEAPEVKETIKEVTGGAGDPPPSGDDPPGFKAEEPKPDIKPPESDLLEVDKPAAEKEDASAKPAEGEKETKKGTEAEKGEENLSPMYLHAAALQENGLLPNFDLEAIKELKTEEQVLKINEHIQLNVSDSIKEGIDAEKVKLGEAQKIYDDIKAGVNPEDLKANLSLEEQYGGVQVKDLEDNDENQETVYANSLYMKGLSEKKVNQLVQVAKDNDSLLPESTEALKEIQTAIKAERTEMRKRADEAKTTRDTKNEETQKNIKTTVSATKAIIPGVELTKAQHEELIKDMTVPVRYTDNGRGGQVAVSGVMDLRSKDPISFDMKLNYFIRQGFFDKDAKFENIIKTATTSATKTLIEKINSEKTVSGKPAVIEDGQKNEKEEEFIFPIM